MQVLHIAKSCFANACLNGRNSVYLFIYLFLNVKKLLFFLSFFASLLVGGKCSHLHLPEVSLEAVSLHPGLSWGRGRICLHYTSPIPCPGGIGYVVVVVSWRKTTMLSVQNKENGNHV